VVIGRCDLAGAKVALIVEIDAIGDCSKPVCLRKLVHHREEFVFTVKTAGGIVTNVFFPVELASANYFDWNRLLLCESNGIRELEAGDDLLVAEGSELGCDGNYVAIPLRRDSELQAFVIFGFGHALPRYVEVALRSAAPSLCRALVIDDRSESRPAASPVLAAVAAS